MNLTDMNIFGNVDSPSFHVFLLLFNTHSKLNALRDIRYKLFDKQQQQQKTYLCNGCFASYFFLSANSEFFFFIMKKKRIRFYLIMTASVYISIWVNDKKENELISQSVKLWKCPSNTDSSHVHASNLLQRYIYYIFCCFVDQWYRNKCSRK